MAKFSRTQMRLGQITGSFGTTLDGQEAGAIRDDLAFLASGSIVASSLSGSLSYMASAIRRIAGGNDFSVNERGHFGGSLQSAYNFHVTGSNFSANQAYTVKSDAGDLTLESAAGSANLLANEASVRDAILLNSLGASSGIQIKVPDADGEAIIGNASGDTFVKVASNSTAAQEIITITNFAGDGTNAIDINATAGGIDIDAATASTIDVADGAFTITTAGTDATDDIVLAAAASISLDGAEAVDDAIKLNASVSGGGIQLLVPDADGIASIGNASLDTYVKVTANNAAATEKIEIVNLSGDAESAITLASTAGGVDIDAAANKDANIAGGQVALVSKDAAASAISLTANVGAAETIVVTNTQGNTAAAITLLASAGGIDADAAGLISLNSIAGSIEATVVDGQTVNLGQTGASALLLSPSSDAADEKASLIVTAGSAADAILLSAPAGGITIGNTGKNVTIPGNLIVDGTTTQINVNELVVEDKVIAMGIPGGMTDPGTATYVINTNIVTVTSAGHNLSATEYVFISDPKDTPVITEGVYVIASVADVDTFTFAFTAGNNATPAAIDHSVDNVTDVTAGGSGIRVAPASADATSLTWSTVGWKIGGPGVAGADTKAGLSPLVDNVGALGSTSLQWADLYLAEEGVINWANGSAVIKEAADILQLSGTLGSSVRSPYLSIDNSSTGVSEIRFQEDNDNGLNYVGFKSAQLLGGDCIWELPMTDGTPDQVLTTDGNKVLTWADPGAGAAQVQSGSISTPLPALDKFKDPAQFKLALAASISDAERSDKINYFVNGQMLLSGANSEIIAQTADYNMIDEAAVAAAATITFTGAIAGGVALTIRVFSADPDIVATNGSDGLDLTSGTPATNATALANYLNPKPGISAVADGAGVLITQTQAGAYDLQITSTSNTNLNTPRTFAGGSDAYATVKFGFDLEVDDVVQVIVR